MKISWPFFALIGGSRPLTSSNCLQFMHMFVQALDMMMVRLLGLADVVIMADDRHAVLAQRAVHVASAAQSFVGPLQESFN
jgi:hypothetical protein